MAEWTHTSLCDRAGRWLCNTKQCKVVLVEPKPWACGEHVDVIGWYVNGESVVIECKVSRGDYLADSYKPWRNISSGMGRLKYYLVPDGMDAPFIHDGCGLLRAKGRRIIVEHEAEPRQQRCWSEEIALLLSNVNRGVTVLEDHQ